MSATPSNEEQAAPNGRKLWHSYVKDYARIHNTTYAQALANCAPLWKDEKIKEAYYQAKYKEMGLEPPKRVPKTRSKPTNTNPGKPGRPKGSVDKRGKRAKMEKEAATPVDKTTYTRKSSNIPPEEPKREVIKVTRKKRLTEMEKKLAEMELKMKNMRPIDDDDDSNESNDDYSEDSSE